MSNAKIALIFISGSVSFYYSNFLFIIVFDRFEILSVELLRLKFWLQWLEVRIDKISFIS